MGVAYKVRGAVSGGTSWASTASTVWRPNSRTSKSAAAPVCMMALEEEQARWVTGEVRRGSTCVEGAHFRQSWLGNRE